MRFATAHGRRVATPPSAKLREELVAYPPFTPTCQQFQCSSGARAQAQSELPPPPIRNCVSNHRIGCARFICVGWHFLARWITSLAISKGSRRQVVWREAYGPIAKQKMVGQGSWDQPKPQGLPAGFRRQFQWLRTGTNFPDYIHGDSRSEDSDFRVRPCSQRCRSNRG